MQEVAEKLEILKKKLKEEEYSALKEIRETVLQLAAPSQLVCYVLSNNDKTYLANVCISKLVSVLDYFICLFE